MNYKAWTRWLEEKSLMPKIAPGLEKMMAALQQSHLYEKLNLQKNVLIAGTNGKGTTGKILQQLLISAGQKAGFYTSPHLVSTCERININNQNIAEDQFIDLCKKYQSLIDKLQLSHFESLTLFAVDEFIQQDCDWNIFEVGMGGTWDATNAIPHKYSLITTLGLDHQDILGPRLVDIAQNKFGIIQKDNVVLHRCYPNDITDLLDRKIQETQSESLVVPLPKSHLDISDQKAYQMIATPWGTARLSILGPRAAENALHALMTFERLGYSPSQHLLALESIPWPARLSPLDISSPCPVYLSGDHNHQGIESLYQILKDWPYENIYFLIGTSKNRPVDEFIKILSKLPHSHFTLTRPSFMGSEYSSSQYDYDPDPKSALEKIIAQGHSHDLIVVTGSLYLCGDILQTL